MRPAASLSLALALAAASHAPDAHANGRPSATNGVFFQQGNSETILVRATFGVLLSRDGGCTFRWLCEENIGYGGEYDPTYAIAADGAIFATAIKGLRVSRDGGCSFTTATAELPEGAPGRIADTFVDTLDLASNGDLWVATSSTGVTNDVYRSTDNGVTFAPRGLASPEIWWRSVTVAPSDPIYVYAAGYQLAGTPAAHLRWTADGGETWKAAALAGLTTGASPVIQVAAIDPADPRHLFVVARLANPPFGDRLFRSTDGGETLTEVVASPQPIADVVFHGASTVIAASGTGGTYRSDDGGATFAPVPNAPRLGCLAKGPGGALIGCAANWDPDFMAVGRSSNGAEWEKIFRFVEMAGPLECPAGTPGHDVCDKSIWPGIQAQYGAKGPTCGVTDPPMGDDTEPSEGGGCCDAGARAPLGAGLLTGLVAWMIGRRRRRA